MIRSLELSSRWRATLTPPNSCYGPEEMEASISTTSHSPFQSLVRRQMPDCPETWYCLEIQVILTKDGGTTPPPPHVWQVPVVEDMLQDGKSGLTEAVVTGPGQAVLFYRRQSLGEGLSLGKVHDAMFTLSGAISWVGKQAQAQCQCSKPVGRPANDSTRPSQNDELRPGDLDIPIPIYCICAIQVLHNQDRSPQEERLLSTEEHVEEPRHTHQTSHHDLGWVPQWGQDHDQMRWDQWAAPPPLPSPSPDHGFKSDRSSVSTSSSVS